MDRRQLLGGGQRHRLARVAALRVDQLAAALLDGVRELEQRRRPRRWGGLPARSRRPSPRPAGRGRRRPPPDSAARVYSWPVHGSITAEVAPSAASTDPPLMKLRRGRAGHRAASRSGIPQIWQNTVTPTGSGQVIPSPGSASQRKTRGWRRTVTAPQRCVTGVGRRVLGGCRRHLDHPGLANRGRGRRDRQHDDAGEDGVLARKARRPARRAPAPAGSPAPAAAPSAAPAGARPTRSPPPRAAPRAARSPHTGRRPRARPGRAARPGCARRSTARSGVPSGEEGDRRVAGVGHHRALSAAAKSAANTPCAGLRCRQPATTPATSGAATATR